MSQPAAADASSRYQTFAEFWPFYLSEHRNPVNRTLHFIGTTGVLAIAITAAILMRPLNLIAAPICGYGFAWVGHFIIEKNRPATFKYPLWSLAGDFRMYFLAITGRLGPHLDAAGVKR